MQNAKMEHIVIMFSACFMNPFKQLLLRQNLFLKIVHIYVIYCFKLHILATKRLAAWRSG